ncbi:MAG: MBL fold metallo-hydrolase [Bryobacteraceae bacterium]
MSFEPISEHLFRLRDTCNVYALIDGDAALLIDGGSGAALEHLAGLGVTHVEWVLHTHHHRDQCWGDHHLVRQGAKLAVPEHERHLFEKAELFWQTRRVFDNYDDRNTFFTTSENLPVAASLIDYEEFAWRGYRFYVLPAKGHTPGSVALVAPIDGRLIVFTGDLMARGGVLYQLHAMEYTYSDTIGALFTLQSIQTLRDLLKGEEIAGKRYSGAPLLLPSHGDPIHSPLEDIDRLERSIMELASLGRGMRVAGRDSIPEPQFLPEPKLVPLSEHLLWGGPWTCSFFYVLLSRSGKAMFLDYGHSFFPHMHIFADHGGMETMRFVEHHLKELRRDYGVTSFDLAVPTHIHDDHTCGIPHLQRFYGTKCWALDEVAQVIQEPAAWASTPCVFPKPIRVDRVLSDRETFEWEEYTFHIHFAPGQTEYHSVLSAEIDGRKVAFTGDNWFMHDVFHAGKTDSLPFQTTVLRNSFQLWMHRRCIEVMEEIRPQLICPGHWGVWPCDPRALQQYADYIRRKERVFRKLVGQPADHYIDLFWARLLPYVAEVAAGEEQIYRLLLRNNFEEERSYQARLLPPAGWTASGGYTSVVIPAHGKADLTLTATAPVVGDGVRRLLTAEIRIDGVSQGPIAEALVTVRV